MQTAVIRFLLLAIIGTPIIAMAQGTAFFYQGRLDQDGHPATGLYDMQFGVWNGIFGADKLAGPILRTNIAVTNGIFGTTLDFGDDIFTGPARWLEIQVRTNGPGVFETLAPRQELLPAPYAIHAATAGNVAAGAAVKSLNNLTDDIRLDAGPNVTITPNGNTLTLSAAGVGGSGIWNVNNNHAYYLPGNVGIGSSTPTHRLRVSGGPWWTTAFWTGSVELDNAAAIGWPANAAGQRFGMGHSTGGFYFFSTASDLGTVGAPPNYHLSISDAGNVGIGTPSATGKLEVSSTGGDILRLVGYEPFLTLYDSNHGYARSTIQGVDGSMNFFTEAYLRGTDPFGYIHLNKSGKVGIGSATPVSKLDIVAQDALSMFGYQPFLTLWDVNAGYARSRIQGVNGDVALMTEGYINSLNQAQGVMVLKNGSGNVGIGTATPQAKLDVAGNIRTTSLTILGGADLAEPFVMPQEIPKGSVVVIDDANPGKLKLSTQQYDTRVAGIVSGANGINPGIALYQEGALEGGQNVALSGRVYVQADATFGAIKPGDLLTTSATPGHAMRVTDHAKAQGAILGKAMGSLKEGQGMVLVLVTLQ